MPPRRSVIRLGSGALQLLASLLAGAALVSPAVGQTVSVPERITLQGTIEEVGGTPVQDQLYTFRVRIFELAIPPAPPATETEHYSQEIEVFVANGAYSMVIDPLTAGLSTGSLRAALEDHPRFVEIAVIDPGSGSVLETLPRQPLTSVPYALSAQTAQAVGWAPVGDPFVLDGESSVIIPNLDGNRQSAYKLVFAGSMSTASVNNVVVTVRPNSDTTASAYDSHVYMLRAGASNVNNADDSGMSAVCVNAAITNSYDVFLEMTLQAESGRPRLSFTTGTASQTPGGNLLTTQGAMGRWNNQSDPITSLWFGTTDPAVQLTGTLTLLSLRP